MSDEKQAQDEQTKPDAALDEHQQNMLALLRHMSQMVREGKLVALSVLGVQQDTLPTHAWLATPYSAHLLAAGYSLAQFELHAQAHASRQYKEAAKEAVN